MGTGIVSVALSLDGLETLSRILLAICAAAWVVLVALLLVRLTRDRERVEREARSPSALTGVAATEVLGSRLTLLGWHWAGIAALVIALALWLVLIGPVLTHWTIPTVGVSFMLAVATESLAVLSATVAAHEHARWLLHAALVPFAVGLCFYGFVLARFDTRQIGRGRGDHWIAGGALAISTLAAGRLTDGARALAILGNGGGVLEGLAVGLWVLTMLWLPLLLVAELLRPRLSYDLRRWSTVFPVGMYAACSFVVGAAAHAGAITSFARVWAWVALAVWAVVFVGLIRRTSELAADRP